MRASVAVLTVLGCMAASAPALADGPVVVELFTSQGCSSCPPADAMLRELALRDDVLALAFHVDYWDYIGWTDVFGSPDNTARQHAYARAAGVSMVYTPQFVVGGIDHVTGARGMDLADQITAHSGLETGVTLDLTVDGDIIRIAATSQSQQAMTVQIVRFSPLETVHIDRGENAGETLTYANSVRAWGVAAEWDGAEPAEPDG